LRRAAQAQSNASRHIDQIDQQIVEAADHEPDRGEQCRFSRNCIYRGDQHDRPSTAESPIRMHLSSALFIK
jgi:hypothetical protein